LEEESKTIKPILGRVKTRLFDGIKREFTTSHKESRSQILRQPKIGEIILLKDHNVLRRMWKLALIKQYILSKVKMDRFVQLLFNNSINS